MSEPNVNGVPASWSWSVMSAVCDKIQDGTHFSPDIERQLSEGPYPYVTAKNVRPGGLDLSNITYLLEPEHRKIYERCDPIFGDVLLVKDGVNTGDTAIDTIEGEISLLSSVCMLRPKRELILNTFLRYFLLSPVGYRSLTGQMTGTAIKRIILRKVRETPVPLAPLDEQRRIVAKIEELFSDLDAGVAALERAKANLKRYRAAVLKAAVEGKLTAAWRAAHADVEPAAKLLQRILAHRRRNWEKDQLAKFSAAGKPPPKNWQAKYINPTAADTANLPRLPAGWCWATWNQISNWVTYGLTRPMAHVEVGVPIITARHISNGKIDFEATHKTPPNAYEQLSDKDRPKAGDILITKDGTIGRAAVVPNHDGFCINQSVAVVWLRTCPVERDFLLAVIDSDWTQKPIWAKARGVAIQHLSITDFASMPLPVPPISEQVEIAAAIAEKLSQVKAAEAAIDYSQARAARLRQSILKRAFSGQLVPQDPRDETACALLANAAGSRGNGSDNGESKNPLRRLTSHPKSGKMKGRSDQ